MKLRHFYILFTLALLTLMMGQHVQFKGTGLRYDVFLFYDYPNGGRYLANIVYDTVRMVAISALLFLWRYSVREKTIKNVITPFLIVSLLDIADYYLTFQKLAYIKLVILIILIFKYNYKPLAK